MKLKTLIAGAIVLPLTLSINQPVFADLVGYAKCDEEYINIRNSASLDGEVIGKIYNNGQVTIYEDESPTGWYKIKSGNVEGYIKDDYILTGEESYGVADEAGYKVAYVYPKVLIVRAQPNEDAREIDRVYEGQEVEVVDIEGDWAKVCLASDSYGYISEYYIDYKTYYGTAETLEEEQARLDEQWLAYLAAQQVAAEETYEEEYSGETVVDDYYDEDAYESGYDQPDEDWDYADYEPETYANESYSEPTTTYTTETEVVGYEEVTYYDETLESEVTYEEPIYEEVTVPVEEDSYEEPTYSYGGGQYIVDYAMNFVGNPYVYGGTSLTNGADCSGFVQSVFANFGISLNRTAASQSSNGYAVDLSEIQPGDLLFYDNGGYIGHVAIYAGNGVIVHASNPSSGITTSSYSYRSPVCARRCW